MEKINSKDYGSSDDYYREESEDESTDEELLAKIEASVKRSRESTNSSSCLLGNMIIPTEEPKGTVASTAGTVISTHL